MAYEILSLSCRPCALAEGRRVARLRRRNGLRLAALHALAFLAGACLSRVVNPMPVMRPIAYLNQSGY